MNPTIRNSAWALAALALAGLSLAPSAQAVQVVPNPDVTNLNLCPTYNPDAWVNYCVTTTYAPVSVWAYTLDTTPDYTTVCPLPTTCVNVPVILSFVDQALYTVPYYIVNWNVQPNAGQVYEDACDVIGIACQLAQQLLGTLGTPAETSSSLPHGLHFEGVGDADSNGVADLAFFSLPSGETVVLPVL